MNYVKSVEQIPLSDRPVARRNLSNVGNYLGLYGGEHIAATEFVIGATLVQYGCSATDIIIGLIIGNILAVLSFTFLCATIATDTRLTLYSYLGKVFGPTMQKVYNIVLGVGLSALAAAGISISGTAIRRVFNVPIQLEWYPTSIKFIVIVLLIGAVITIIASKGFEAVAKFASTCVPWMMVLFGIGLVVVLPQLLQATGFGALQSPADFLRLLNTHVWNGVTANGGKQLGIIHVIGFAWVCNLAWHVGLNDMSILRFAPNYKYGFISAVGMFVGHFGAWIIAGIMGATSSIILNTPLAELDPGEVTFALLGYAGLLAVIIAGWTTANPTIYRITLSFNAVFPKISQKKLTYIVGVVITALACFPGIQRAADILTFLGLIVQGVGAICITEHYIFPKIGFTRYWDLYRNQKANPAAVIAWVLGIAFTFTMILGGWMHQNIVFVPAWFITVLSYILLAGLMGAKGGYSKQEQAQIRFEKELDDYVNSLHPEQEAEPKAPRTAKLLRYTAFVILAVIVVLGIACGLGGIALAAFKLWFIVLTLFHFLFNGISMALIYRNTASKEVL
ncbi:hypothetical protein LJC63_07330 [Ruminococcaceae bacterium OttesenSCG-928-L11]|nr:hypothetical protein [Ruminococcaceae bacterium OttesenSCG-928-L11]